MTFLNDPREPVKIRCDEDLLALIPHQLGYAPQQCAVLFIPVASGGALCLKLPVPEGSENLTEYAHDLSAALASTEHTGQATVVVYANTAVAESTETDFFRAAWLAVAVEEAGLRATGGFVVGPQQWWNLQRPELPVPVSTIRDSQLNAHMVALGSALATGSPEDPGEVPTALARRSPGVLRALSLRADPPREEPEETNHSVETAEPGAGWARGFQSQTSCEQDLALWARAIGVLDREGAPWAEALLELDDEALAGLATTLTRAVSRDALFYYWLTADESRAASAHRGLRSALTDLLGPAETPAAEESTADCADDDIAEGLRCAHAVLGQWEGIPEWATVEAAYRILEGLDLIMTHGGASVPGVEGSSGTCALVHAGVVSARAQVEIYRGRAFTAAALLNRCRDIAQFSDGAQTVRRRLEIQDIPWWSTDPRTAWPGERWWATRKQRQHAPEKYP